MYDTAYLFTHVLPLSSKCGLNQGVPNGLDKKTINKQYNYQMNRS